MIFLHLSVGAGEGGGGAVNASELLREDGPYLVRGRWPACTALTLQRGVGPAQIQAIARIEVLTQSAPKRSLL